MKNRTLIFTIIGFITLIRLVYINYLPLFGDEAYYWQWARHLAFGYYEQGPMLAYVIWIFTFFTKINTLFTLRLGAVILSMFSMFALYFAYKKFNTQDHDDTDSLLTILLLCSSLIFSLGAVMMMHDTVMVFFYSLFLYNLTNLVKEPENNRHWVSAGILLGLGIMSKLTMGVVYFGLTGFLISTGTFRKYLKGFLCFTLFTLFFTLPLIYWNLTHNLATLKYLFIRSGLNSTFTVKYFFELLGSQAALISPLLFLIFIPAVFRGLKNRAFTLEHCFSMLFIITILPFFVLSLKGRVEANWPIFTFLPLFFLAPGWLRSLKPASFKIISVTVVLSGLLIVLLVHTQAVFPLIKLPVQNDPMKKTYGYSELADKVYRIYSSMPQNEKILLSTRHYQTASLLSFYTPTQPQYYILIDHESNKNYRFWKEWQKMAGCNSLFVYTEPWESAEMAKFFVNRSFTREIDVALPGGNMRKYYIDYFTGLK
jgi:4-amino-4-deoxy-L-arabinose transferase-like glycosyltransferase